MDHSEQIYPFVFKVLSVKQEEERQEWEEANPEVAWPGEALAGIVRLNPKLRKGGYLELHVSDGPVYLFKGALDRFEAQSGSGDAVMSAQGNETVGFDLAAFGYYPAEMKVSADLGEITLYCQSEGTKGYIRIVETC